MDEFIPMAGPVRTVFDTLCELIGFECTHTDKEHTCSSDDCEPTCDRVTLVGLEEVANRIVGMIERGELT
jgi:hypothetical protein